MNDRVLIALTLTLLIVVVGVASAATVSADDKVTICHHPEGNARTMQVSRSAWSAHEGHGDHEGPCEADRDPGRTGGDPDAGPGPESGAEPAPVAHVTAVADAEGDVDGEADFRVVLHNTGDEAHGVRLTGRLHGDGDWSVRSRDADCRVEDRTLTCTLDRLAADGSALVRLRFDGGTRVCHEAGVRLVVEAENDDDADDDRADARTHVGACSVLERRPA